MMEEIKPKKERKFLKAVGNIAKVLANELVMGIARKFIGKAIDKVGNKRQGLVIALVILASTFAIAQFPNTTNKQRLGFQTTADGLVWRGSLSDTASIQPVNNQNAWVIIDTVNLKLYSFDFTSNVWNLISGSGGGLIMPFDSITFNTAKNGTVGVGEVEYNDTQGSLIQGLKGGNVTNVIGQQLHQRVNNRTGATLNKGDVVYLAGSQGNRITVAKGLAVSDAFSANTFGVVAESIADNQSGFIITEGLITGLNTSALTEDSAVYLSPTVAGALTSTKPQAPQHSVYIGVCVKSNNGSGELFVKIRNGQELDELHDVRITSPVDRASLYYRNSDGLWRDTTAALLVSDTASMLSNYATKAYADTTGRFYARQEFRNVSSSTLTWTQSDTLVVNDTTSLQVYRNGQILMPNQYTVPTSTSVVIASTSYKAGENYTVIFPRGGGGGGSGSGSLTSISAGTGITVTPNPITTTGVVSADLSVLMELTDTTLLNLTSRFATKQNDIILTTTGVSGAATLSNDTLNIPQYSGGGSVTNIATGYGITGGPITTTGTLVIDSSTIYNFVRDSIVNVQIGRDTIKILKQEYNNVTSDTLTWTTTNKFPIQLRAYILLFRNGQLLINDQYSIIDTNKVKVAATSYKIGENYTLVTVSGITSISSGQNNTVYPEAGIAVSTGTTWTTSIPNNSTNWNTAFTDRLKWDGGSTGLTPSTGRTSLGGTTIGQSMFTLTNPSSITFPRFNSDNSISALNAASFRSAIGAGTVTEVDASTTAGNPISITNKTTTPIIELLSATSGRNGYLTSTDWTTFNNKLNISDTASMLSNYNSRINLKLNITDTAAMLSNYNSRINLKVNISDTTNMLNPYFRDADTTSLNLTSRFAAKQNNLTLTTTGTSGAATLIGSTLNIPQYTGGGGGSGTVTSVGLTAPSIFTVSGSPVTTSGTLALTYSGTALPILNGGTGATTADGALTNFGASAMGKSLFGLTNSVSDKFIKVNSNNTITLTNAADTRTAIGSPSSATLISTSSPLSGGGDLSANRTISISQSSGSVNGFLSSADWTTFNNKQNALTLTTTGTSGAATLTGATLNIPQYSGGSGTVTNISVTAPLTITNPTTTPLIQINAANGTSSSGIVTTGIQQFGGAKTFNANLTTNGNMEVDGTMNVDLKATFGAAIKATSLERNVVNTTGTSITLGIATTWLNIHQSGNFTVTLPNAATYPGKEIHIRNSSTGVVLSASSNIIAPDVSHAGATTTLIISGVTPAHFATLVSDGTNWVITQFK